MVEILVLKRYKKENGNLVMQKGENWHCELPWPHGPPQRVTWLAFTKQATKPTEPLNVNCFQTLLCKPWIIFKNELLCVAYCVHFENYKSKQTIECQINQELGIFFQQDQQIEALKKKYICIKLYRKKIWCISKHNEINCLIFIPGFFSQENSQCLKIKLPELRKKRWWRSPRINL
jgi:hypothetical protein